MLGRVATKAGRAATQYRRRPHAGVLNLSSFRQLVTSSSAPCAARQAASCAAAGETQASRRGVPVFLLPSPFCRRLSSATPKVAKPRAKVGPKAAAKPASVSDFLSQYWAYGIMGTLIAGGAFFTYNSIQDGQNPLDAVKEVIDDLFDNAEAMSDPDPEQFNIQFLQMSGNPIQHIPMVAQDGEKIAPNIAIVLAMEGTLVKRVHDRKYGFRHIKRPAVAPLMKSLQGMDVSAFFWVKHMSNQSLGDPECIVYKMLKSEKLIRVAQEMSACVFSRSHMYSVNGQPQIRISPLPRFTPNILLVDNDRWNYDAQPDNTLLIKEFTDEEADDGSALMDVLAFMKLFRHLWKKQEVKTVQQTMRWLKMRHPEIVVDPTRMGEFIRAEAADLLENEHRLQTESVGRVLKDLHRGSATLRGARAVTAHSSTYERVHQSSALADRISKAKERQAALIAQHQQKMAEEAAGSMSDQ